MERAGNSKGARFVSNLTKVKIPSEVKPALKIRSIIAKNYLHLPILYPRSSWQASNLGPLRYRNRQPKHHGRGSLGYSWVRHRHLKKIEWFLITIWRLNNWSNSSTGKYFRNSTLIYLLKMEGGWNLCLKVSSIIRTYINFASWKRIPKKTIL